MLAVLTIIWESLKDTRSTQANRTLLYRPNGLHLVVTPDVLGEVVERAGREDCEWTSDVHRNRGSARHGSVATADAEHLGPFGRSTKHPLQVVALGEFDDLGFRQLSSDVADNARPGPAAGGRVDHEDHAPAVWSRRRFDAQRVSRGELVLDDRGNQARAQHRDRRADAEAHQDVAGIVGTSGDAR